MPGALQKSLAVECTDLLGTKLPVPGAQKGFMGSIIHHISVKKALLALSVLGSYFHAQ